MKIDELAKRIVNCLIVEELEIKFDKIIDDSRLYPKEGLIVISEKYKENYIECAKSLTHEYRHVFQIYYANLVNDELAKLEIRTTNKEDAVINCFNNILRALGTDVVEDKTKSHDIYDKNYRHEISVIKGTKLYDLINKEEYRVNSIHSMIAPKENVEKYAKISAVSYDDLVECFELDNKKFIMGIKWHPELMLEDKFPNKLFNEFISKCNN